MSRMEIHWASCKFIGGLVGAPIKSMEHFWKQGGPEKAPHGIQRASCTFIGALLGPLGISTGSHDDDEEPVGFPSIIVRSCEHPQGALAHIGYNETILWNSPSYIANWFAHIDGERPHGKSPGGPAGRGDAEVIMQMGPQQMGHNAARTPLRNSGYARSKEACAPGSFTARNVRIS